MPHPPVYKTLSVTDPEMPLLQRMTLFFASGFGAGYSPLASGTVATIFAIPFYLVLFQPLNHLVPWQIFAYLALLLLFFAAGVSASTQAESLLQQKDPHFVTVDEFAGFFMTMFLVPFSVQSLVAGFFLFRLFDVWKPWPINSSQNLPHGLGIMIDDVLAGIYSCIVLNILFRLVIG